MVNGKSQDIKENVQTNHNFQKMQKPAYEY